MNSSATRPTVAHPEADAPLSARGWKLTAWITAGAFLAKGLLWIAVACVAWMAR